MNIHDVVYIGSLEIVCCPAEVPESSDITFRSVNSYSVFGALLVWRVKSALVVL